MSHHHRLARSSHFSRYASASWTEVLECHIVTGEHDYLLKVVAHGTISHLEHILTRGKLATVPGVDRLSDEHRAERSEEYDRAADRRPEPAHRG